MQSSTQEVCPQVPVDTSKMKLGEIVYETVVKWEHWLKMVGIHDATGRRWRDQGMITPSINIRGKLYLTTGDIATFIERAKRGEFAKEIVMCKPNRATAVEGSAEE